MEQSILLSIKKVLGIATDYTGFDEDVLMHINTAIMALNQLGVGPAAGLVVEGQSATWADLMDGETNIEAIKSYILLKVRLIFDPPSSGFVTQAMNDRLKEIEYRIFVQVDPPVV